MAAVEELQRGGRAGEKELRRSDGGGTRRTSCPFQSEPESRKAAATEFWNVVPPRCEAGSREATWSVAHAGRAPQKEQTTRVSKTCQRIDRFLRYSAPSFMLAPPSGSGKVRKINGLDGGRSRD
jgi:hypothetical protein